MDDTLLRQYKRKKLLLWTIRWGIAVGLTIGFWHIAWVRWTLLLTVPVALFGLHMILFGLEETRHEDSDA